MVDHPSQTDLRNWQTRMCQESEVERQNLGDVRRMLQEIRASAERRVDGFQQEVKRLADQVRDVPFCHRCIEVHWRCQQTATPSQGVW